MSRDSIGDMKTTSPLLLFTALLVLQHAQGQQPSPQPTQGLDQPCVTTSTPNPSDKTSHFKLPNKLQQALNKQLGKIQAETGVDAGGTAADMQQAAKSKPAPCIPQAGSPKTTQPVPTLHLPTGVVSIWLCNPIVTSTDPSHTVSFVTPDALTNAEPAQAGAFEADGAKADPKATVSCASLRRDPKNNRVFLAQ